jgi:hypothetical protein
VNTFIFPLKLFLQHTEKHLDLNVKAVIKVVFVVVMMAEHIDLLDGKAVMENIVDVMMVLETDHDLVVDLVEAVLLSRLACT